MKKVSTAELTLAIMDLESDISILRVVHGHGPLHIRIESPETVLNALKELASQREDYGKALTKGIPKYPDNPKDKKAMARYQKDLKAWCKAAGLPTS